MVRLTGSTTLVGVFGYPIRHTASPAFHNAAFDALGLDWAYLAFEVAPERLAAAVEGMRALGLRGVNVTIPHKQTILPFLDDLSEQARRVGAVNTVVNEGGRLCGHTTDGAGFARAFEEETGRSLSGLAVVMAGAGGAGTAVGVHLVEAGTARVTVYDTDSVRATALAERLNRLRPGAATAVTPGSPVLGEAVRSCDLFVNATPVGMHGNEMPGVEAEWFQPPKVVYDLVYRPPKTALLREASRRGCRTLNGLGMLLYQGAAAFELWTRQRAPVGVMRPALEAAVYGSQSPGPQPKGAASP